MSSNPWEEAGRQRKATALVDCLHDLGIHSDEAPAPTDDKVWAYLARMADVKLPSVETRALVLRLMPIGECSAKPDTIRHAYRPGHTGCIHCGVDPFAVFNQERAAFEGTSR